MGRIRIRLGGGGRGGGAGGGVGGGVGSLGANSWLEGGGGLQGGGVQGGGGEGIPLPPGVVVSEGDQALHAVNFLKRYLNKDLANSLDALIRDHIPPVPAPAPVQTPTERQKAEQFARLVAEQEKLTKRLAEGRDRIERMTVVAGEVEGVTRQVEAHKAETVRRATEATAPRVEEVGSDMDVGGGSDTGEEVGVNFEAGKRRKVVRKGHFSASAGLNEMGPDAIISALQRLSATDKERCKKHFLHEFHVGEGINEVAHEASEFEEGKVEFNARAATASTQEDVANTPCG